MNVLVTGATRGLGLVIAERLLNSGHQVIAVARAESSALTSLQVRFGAEAMRFVPCDLSQTRTIKQKVFGALDATPIHGLVNNAASAYDDLVTNMQVERLDEMFHTNVYAPIELTKLAIRNMLLHKIRGSVVHLSSVCVHTGYKGLSMYGATKGALEAFSKNVAREWGTLGIRSNCVVAGFMETEMSSTLSAEQKQKIYQRTALKRSTSKQSVAEMIEFLLSDKSLSVTGQNMFVDAGTI